MDTPSTNPPTGLGLKLESRTADDLAADGGRHATDDVWRCVQRGLVYPSPYATFVTFFRRRQPAAAMTKQRLGRVLADARHEIHEKFRKAHTTAVLGVDFDLWREMSIADGTPLPAGMLLQFGDDASQAGSAARPLLRSAVFTRPATAFMDSKADLWFHIKSDDEKHCEGMLAWLRRRLEETESWADGARTVWQAAATKSDRPDKRGGKVLGSRFSENLNNATDPLTVQQQTIVGLEDPAHLGASFVLAQRFVINWEQILSMAPQHVEDLVGRTTDDTLIPSRDDRSHIKRARAQDEHGNTMSVLRLGLPFGRSRAIERNDLLEKGASRRDEEGIYFAGYAMSARVLETIMDRQIGHEPGFMADRLLAHVKSNLGGFYYIPSLPDLGLPVETRLADGISLKRFPGVDWSRLDRHFDQKSDNGYMHYNHKQYLYRMATMSSEERRKFHPPSHRVLALLADAFSRWQDNWYFDRAQPEMSHLRVYLERDFGKAAADQVMSLSIEERAGWTAKVLLGHVLTSDAYGFRGRRTDQNGNTYNGADTYHINPLEIIVGAMPNLGLGQGKYLIDFAREDEQLSNFFDNLSYASGVGHIVPQLGAALRLGLRALTGQVTARRDAARDEKRRRFLAGAALALEGVAEHCRAFARLAAAMAKAMPPGQAAECNNLGEIHDRMTRLAEDPPATLAEAAQLLFTLHSCLHHVGEPTAVGRLDQLLQPFYEADLRAGRLDEARAQEIIDCFWVKVGEKVQLNRQFVEDHQVFGNLAMGGSSGNYPQGSSLNQWIQQVTVGGTIADDSPGAGRPAYNDLTRMCLRAARRLPLNAPCLSLRMRPDIPADLVHEAALAILSGGAHPILLSDEKVTPGLQQSGDRIGQGHGAVGSTPVAEKAGELWSSAVSLRDARDYACDGCYEPQLSGTSWFTLGGLTSIQVLEAALNQGKTWQSAGPVWFRGQRVSFTSEPAREIDSFERLIELFFKHLRWMYAKQADGQIGLFGRMNAVCPAPLLSVFIDDCLEKGLDYYEGGPRYNVIAPCFTGLSTLIDSLWAIRALVFEPPTAVTSLPELVDALRCDWGENMAEPFVNVLEGPARIEARAERYRRLREAAMKLPRFGRGNPEVDAFGDGIVGRVARTAVEVFTDPAERTAAKMLELARRLGTKECPFGGFQIQPGVGSFENYLDWGNMSGASADGRRSGDPLASDLSPAPSFGDLPIDPNEAPLVKVMKGYAGAGVEAMWDGAPTDFNIREDFPVEALEQALVAFAQGRGSSIMTITCANADTYEQARRDPEKYDLLRARMGGWTEFFVTMFPAHQAQHQRRPFETSH
jgi:Dyp-type peroxidase family